MNPAPGWYPDPRPGHSNLQAWWDGRQWHLGATKLTTGAEITWWIVGIVAGLALSVVFPPALVMVAGLGMWWYFANEQKKRQAAAQAEWYRQQEPGP